MVGWWWEREVLETWWSSKGIADILWVGTMQIGGWIVHGVVLLLMEVLEVLVLLCVWIWCFWTNV
jgi:hypothetical protein